MPITWTGLAPHPPIIVESVGKERCREALPTIRAMKELAQDFVSRNPQRLVVISPHTPRPRSGIGVWRGNPVSGDLSQFGAPDARISLPVDDAWLERFSQHFSEVVLLGDESLDHGAMVPLHFLCEAGWRGSTVVLGLPWDEDVELDRIGEAMGLASEDAQNTAILASGDMSHCLKPGAPCGYDKRGARFDKTFVDLIKQADYHGAAQIDPELKEAARQDVVESCRIAWQASNYQISGRHFYSYEGPFGVGYAVMRFFGAAHD